MDCTEVASPAKFVKSRVGTPGVECPCHSHAFVSYTFPLHFQSTGTGDWASLLIAPCGIHIDKDTHN